MTEPLLTADELAQADYCGRADLSVHRAARTLLLRLVSEVRHYRQQMAQDVWHWMPGDTHAALCGADATNQQLTTIVPHVTCLKCLRAAAQRLETIGKAYLEFILALEQMTTAAKAFPG